MSMKDVLNSGPAKVAKPKGERFVGPLVKLLEKPQKKRRKAHQYHASGLHNLCPREAAITDRLLEVGVPSIEQIPISLRFTFDLGNAVHEWFQQEYFKLLGGVRGAWECVKCGNRELGVDMWETHCSCSKDPTPHKYAELTFRSDELRVVGSCDGVLVEDNVQGWPEMIFELKTISIGQFDSLKKPKPEHYTQVQIYMWLSGIKHAIVVYACKAFTRETPFKEFQVEYDPEHIQPILDDLQDVKTAQEVKSVDIARKLCIGPGVPRAKQCPYSEVCFGGETVKNLVDAWEEGKADRAKAV